MSQNKVNNVVYENGFNKYLKDAVDAERRKEPSRGVEKMIELTCSFTGNQILINTGEVESIQVTKRVFKKLDEYEIASLLTMKTGDKIHVVQSPNEYLKLKERV